MRVALVYDRINKWGGAERVLLAFHKIFPNAHLFTSVVSLSRAPWAKVFKKIESSFLENFPLAKSYHQLYASLMPLAFESFSFDDYDLVISITSEAAKGIITKPYTKHICYCLTPTRYLWSGYKEYFKNPILRNLSKTVVSYLRNWDKTASQRPDCYIAISKEVQKRIKKYYGREAIVIYPPVTIQNLTQSKIQHGEQDSGDYFLVVSRLVPYKRVDIAIKACNRLRLPLKIVGKGSQELFLRFISGPTIEFLGELTDEKLSFYYKSCKALIFPGSEDFGLTIVEAQAAGRPVIAYRGGGAVEIIKEEKTGEFFNKQDSNSLIKVLAKWDNKRYNSSLCIENSQRFSYQNFKQEFLKNI